MIESDWLGSVICLNTNMTTILVIIKIHIHVYYLMGEKAIWLDIAQVCGHIFHKPQVSENTAQECNIQPYCLLPHQIIDLLYTTLS